PVNLSVWKWEALATGIALATGRRAIEVLIQGEFEQIGKYSISFSGQAKERTGIDHTNKFEIYSLIDADKVISAIEVLRNYPNIKAMIKELNDGRHYQFNELVHNRTATHLNNFMREMMSGANIDTGIGRNWVFKDTRAIYAAICFKLFFDTDDRWKNVDQDNVLSNLTWSLGSKSSSSL
ncbi:protelomerase family protein, partial [Photobacterium phosphoreum]|uniref:protelomerase family protein n=1 Tax=Photobacterium phosphoreum TaxID=659 RepID=UPI001F2E5B7D